MSKVIEPAETAVLQVARLAFRVAGRMGADATVVTLMVDSGLKYLSTEVYRRL